MTLRLHPCEQISWGGRPLTKVKVRKPNGDIEIWKDHTLEHIVSKYDDPKTEFVIYGYLDWTKLWEKLNEQI